jgi:hypothetical protein
LPRILNAEISFQVAGIIGSFFISFQRSGVEAEPVTLQRHVKSVLMRVGGFLGLEACFVVGMWWGMIERLEG